MFASLPKGQVLAMSINHRQRLPDIDPEETDEWLEALRSVVEAHGVERARLLLHELMAESEDLDVKIAPIAKTPMSIPSLGTNNHHTPEILKSSEKFRTQFFGTPHLWSQMRTVESMDLGAHLHLCLLLNALRSRIQPCIPW